MTQELHKTIADGIPVFCAHDSLADTSELIPNPRNPNKHPINQIEILSKIIKSQGWRSPIVVSKRSGFIVKGHGRYQAALKLGVDKIPVDFQNYENEAKEYADLVADNRLAELSEVDNDLLKDIITELKDTDILIDITGFTEIDIENWLKQDLINAGNENGPTPKDQLENYENSTIRQIMLIMDAKEFEEIMQKLDIIKKRHELDDNTTAAMTAIREYANTCN